MKYRSKVTRRSPDVLSADQAPLPFFLSFPKGTCFSWTAAALSAIILVLTVQTQAQPKSPWRAATPVELEAFLPARAPVIKERIETELRTATGITDARGHTVAAVVLITAGYAADGKYSHYLLTQAPMRIGDLRLPPGPYVLGWNRTADGILIHIFDASTGAERGSIPAHPSPTPIRIEGFRIWPPAERKLIQIGRFIVPYTFEP